MGRHDKKETTKILKSQSTKKPRYQGVQTSVYFTEETLKAIEMAKARLFAEHDLRTTKSKIIEAAVRKAISDLNSLAEILRE